MVTREEIEVRAEDINQLTDTMLARDSINKYATNAGSFSRDIIRTVATELLIQENYYLNETMKYQPATAEGTFLDKICEEDQIFRIAAIPSTGIVKVYGEPGALIKKGYIVSAENVEFTVLEDLVIPANGIVGNIDVKVVCTEGGVVGNVGVGNINKFSNTYAGLLKVENLKSFENGKEEETDIELRERRIEILSKPIINYNKYQIEKLILENIDLIEKVKVIPRVNGAGTAKVVLVEKGTTIVSSEVINNIEIFLEEEIITDASFTVSSVKYKEITLTMEVILNKAYTEQAAKEYITLSLNKFFYENLFSEKRIYYTEVIAKLNELDCFTRTSNVDISNIKDDIILDNDELAKISTITFKVLD